MTDSKNFGKARFVLLVIIPIFLLFVSLIVYLQSGRYVETDNAYIQSDIVPISSEVSGIVEKVHVVENQWVEKGQVLFELEPEPFLLEIEKSEAKLQEAKADLSALKVSYAEKKASIDLARSNAIFAKKELERQQDLKGKNFVSASTFDDLEHAVDISEQQLKILMLDLKKIEASLGGDATLSVTAHPRYIGAVATVRSAELNLKKTKILSPSTGYVSQLVKQGSYAKAGNMLSALVENESIWVDANYPETDLTYVREGQSVAVHIDTYPEHTWEGRVESISPATGAEFAILPPQNATGNWVKIAQRIPVRISLNTSSNDMPLRTGMSAVVEIDTKHKKNIFKFLAKK
ncbi:MAG: HlyD family secretion protein [Cellvibrionaceae bacterium]